MPNHSLPRFSEIEDCTQEWSFRPDSIDYVHIRYLYGSIRDWDALYREAFKACKPGGWVENAEASPVLESDDREIPPTSAVSEWGKFFLEGGKKTGRLFSILSDDLQIKGMTAAGFTDIHVENFKVWISQHTHTSNTKQIGRCPGGIRELGRKGDIGPKQNDRPRKEEGEKRT